MIKHLLFALLFLQTLSCAAKANTDHADSAANTESSRIVRGQFFAARIVSWTQGPEVSGDVLSDINNSCIIEIQTADGQIPSSISVLHVFPFMKVHGHGAPDEQIKMELNGNQLKVSKIAFTMSGPWELHLRATVNGQTEELEIPVAVP
jgi:hypothetical protein